ncbi:PREDICTED: uncharacterized protein LOC104586719 isoform X5 [Nelumbo nucifera]|uniref:Uncharacterized protein LOC104586719 isoform X5 n=2 Tax=Nelumbo nucifera TaxID=4432 RepID=A0A1U7Z4P3_NELNU|nr:PREDICTED: uncharacterized protein LOC104586719 isoform X5 [Nelumbo nucifera]DAD31141.1 TPA_asm: hypothetical protein HUJ06_009992 [Nelumbo nucifera]
MVSFITASNYFVSLPLFVVSRPHFPSLVFLIHPRRRLSASSGILVAKKSTPLGTSCPASTTLLSPVLFLRKTSSSGSLRMCKGWESEGDPALEAEILDFMEKSDNPNVFPTKKELIVAGRMDLVQAIGKQCGWLALGWDIDEEEDTLQDDEFRDPNSMMSEEVDNGLVLGDDRLSQQRFDNISGDERNSLDGIDVESSEVSSSFTSSSCLASSSDKPIEMEGGEDPGIEGILNRLEKERSLCFGIDSRNEGSSTHLWRKQDRDDWRPENSVDMDFDGIRSSLKPDMWRTWSTQRAGASDHVFEAAEVVSGEGRAERVIKAMSNEMLTSEKGGNEIRNLMKEQVSTDKGNEHNPIQSRLLNLESELASVLHLLRSNAVIMPKGHESSSEELQRLSDAWEFQETEIMKTQDKLRATHAKLVVLEGKMAMKIIEAQKMVEEKQKRIDDAQNALRLLRTACIVWPNSASEVLLAGSFDGWASQRKMEKSSTGIFSLCLKLYPGRYEIKFIVDGVWTVDPLRPIVKNNGYENNLLIIT